MKSARSILIDAARSTGIQADESAIIDRVARATKDPFFLWRPLPAGEQAAFVEDATSDDASGVIVLRGGNRSGKTDAGAYCLAYRARVTLDAIARDRASRGQTTVLWAIGTTYEHVGNVIWKEKLRQLLPERMIESVTWNNRAAENPQSVRLRNGIEIVFKTGGQGRESMQAAGLFGVWVDEQIDPNLMSELNMRCLDHSAPLVWTFTPLNPDPLLEQALLDHPKGWRFYRIDMEDNRASRGGYLPDDGVDLMLAQLKAQYPDEFETRKSGHLMASEGLIFKGFNRATHVVESSKIRRLIADRRGDFAFIGCGVDFGRTVPTACVWGARDGNGRWYIFAEHYRAEWTIDRHADAMAEINRDWGITPEWLACDPGDQSGTSIGADVTVSGRKFLRHAGYHVINADKRWSDGVRTIQRLMAPEITIGKGGRHEYGEPSIYISDECPNLIREIGMYRRLPGTTATDRDGAVKKDDHAVDALRYMLHTYEARHAGCEVGSGPVGGDRHRRGYAGAAWPIGA